MMKLYPQNNLDKKIFIYRLSHASSIDYTFRIFAAGWRIYEKFIIASVFTAQKIIQTKITALHNYVMFTERNLNII